MTETKDINRKLFLILTEIKSLNKSIDDLISELSTHTKKHIVEDIIFDIEVEQPKKQTTNE